MKDKVKFQLEYIINSSPKILYSYLEEPSALAQWFADDVTVRKGIYEFVWDDEKKQAQIVSSKENEFVRFKLINEEPYFFEMKIIQDELTNDVALAITDFAKEEDLENRKLIWNNSIDYLQGVLGA
ncbi:MAG TPA: START-like domain-containing protein [Sphingobacterium sp.]|nr:START-like domain-containing protein [Sphingobacterium sp.]